jgi:hypothetical protein
VLRSASSTALAVLAALAAVACGRLGFDERPSESAVGAGADGLGGAASGAGGGNGSLAAGGDVGQGELCPDGCERATAGLLVLYEFGEAAGGWVRDTAGLTPAIDLALPWGPGPEWGAGVLELGSPSLLSSGVAPARVYEALEASGALTLEAWITPAARMQYGPARILTSSGSASLRNFTLSQSAGSYAVRLRTTTTDENGFPELTTTPSAALRRQHVVFTHQPGGAEELYLDGRLVSVGVRDGELVMDDTLPLGVGAEFNEALDSRDWLGGLDLLALYDRALASAEVRENFLAGGGRLQDACAPDCSARYADALYFEDFEATDHAVPEVAVATNGALLEVTHEESKNGEHSLHAVQGGYQSEAEVRAALPSPTTSGQLYARAWVRVPEGAVTGTFKVLALNGGMAPGLDFNLLPGGVLDIYSQITTGFWRSGRDAYPTNEWFCLEVAVDVSDTFGSVSLSVGGARAFSAPTDTLPEGGVAQAVYGFAFGSVEQTGGEVFIDDVVVDDKPIGCE